MYNRIKHPNSKTAAKTDQHLNPHLKSSVRPKPARLTERRLAAVAGSDRVAIPGVVEASETACSTTDQGGLQDGNLPQAIGATQ